MIAALLLPFLLYGQAVRSCGTAEGSAAWYLGEGNVSLRMGDEAPDPGEKTRHYAQALETYREGIVRHPQDVPLKYNYETALRRIEDLLENGEPESREQGEEGREESDGEQEQEESGGEPGQEESGGEQEQEESVGSEGREPGGEEPESAGEDGREDSPSEGDGGQESSAREAGAPDEEEIARILAILEGQEGESLKNNREMAGGEEDVYGW